MNDSIRLLHKLAGNPTKNIIGLMSGTSLDGLDIALCEVSGAGRNTEVKLSQFSTASYPSVVRSQLQKIMSVEEVPLEEVCIMHSRLGDYHAELIQNSLKEWGLQPDDIDCIASHGQTIYHAPIRKHGREGMPNSTLQIVDGDHIARKTGILTISDFRQKHTAGGGEGAPMAALVDELLFRDGNDSRLLLNIGGIANFTYLPALLDPEPVVTTDTGPGNTLIDAAMHKFFDQPFDKYGEKAADGEVNETLLERLKRHPFFDEGLPRTTGPEQFNLGWVEKEIEMLKVKSISNRDLIATLTRFSAETIAEGISGVTGNTVPEVYISGGGMYNRRLVKWISEFLHTSVSSFEEIGFNPDAKEAVVFAVLANEMLSGEGFYMGAGDHSKKINFGKISFPK